MDIDKLTKDFETKLSKLLKEKNKKFERWLLEYKESNNLSIHDYKIIREKLKLIYSPGKDEGNLIAETATGILLLSGVTLKDDKKVAESVIYYLNDYMNDIYQKQANRLKYIGNQSIYCNNNIKKEIRESISAMEKDIQNISGNEICRSNEMVKNTYYKEYMQDHDCIVMAVWHSCADERTCSQCLDLEGSEWVITKIEVMPPIHSGCRCWITYYILQKKK